MPFFLIIIFGVMLFPNDEMVELRQHSTGTGQFAKVMSVDCTSGLRNSGYSYAPDGRVYFKEVNADGTVAAPVCAGGVNN